MLNLLKETDSTLVIHHKLRNFAVHKITFYIQKVGLYFAKSKTVN